MLGWIMCFGPELAGSIDMTGNRTESGIVDLLYYLTFVHSCLRRATLNVELEEGKNILDVLLDD